MGLLSVFKKKPQPISSVADFWNWFGEKQKTFFSVVKNDLEVERDFINILHPVINNLHEGIYLLTGMYDTNTVELIFTAEGQIQVIPLIEELVANAPIISGWKFTALKPELGIDDVNVKMQNFSFNKDCISFYAKEHGDFPDEVDIVLVYDDFDEGDKSIVSNGCFIFLDNFLGELNFVTTIDNVSIIGRSQAEKELIPIVKLKDYLLWRKSEFIEKYSEIREPDEFDEFAGLEAVLANGNSMIAVVNAKLLRWDCKSSHQWLVDVTMKYDGTISNGMPDQMTVELLDAIEGRILDRLTNKDGYLFVGRQTGGGARVVYLACKDFREPAIVLEQMVRQYRGSVDISFEMFKDKYWRLLNKFVK